MTMRCFSVSAFVIVCYAAVIAGETDTRRAEQQELLAWVRTLQLQARVDQALAVCDMVLAADPGNVEALTQRGIINLGEGRLEQAMEDFNRALRSHGDNPLALVGRGRARVGLRKTQEGHADGARALAICTRAIEKEEADARTWFVRGLAHLLLDRRDEALQDFAMAGNLDDTLVEAHIERAGLYRRDGRLNRAAELLTHVVEVRPDCAVAYLARARVHFEAQNFAAAVADCDEALQINPHYARAWHNRGLIHLQMGDAAAAIGDLTRAIAVREDYASAYYYRGQAQYVAGNRAAAQADWESARELAPDQWAGQAAADALSRIERGEL